MDMMDFMSICEHLMRRADDETDCQHKALEEFCEGKGVVPSLETKRLTALLTRAAMQTIEPDITVDDDGALAFDVREGVEAVVFAELSVDGTVSALRFCMLAQGGGKSEFR